MNVAVIQVMMQWLDADIARSLMQQTKYRDMMTRESIKASYNDNEIARALGYESFKECITSGGLADVEEFRDNALHLCTDLTDAIARECFYWSDAQDMRASLEKLAYDDNAKFAAQCTIKRAEKRKATVNHTLARTVLNYVMNGIPDAFSPHISNDEKCAAGELIATAYNLYQLVDEDIRVQMRIETNIRVLDMWIRQCENDLPFPNEDDDDVAAEYPLLDESRISMYSLQDELSEERSRRVKKVDVSVKSTLKKTCIALRESRRLIVPCKSIFDGNHSVFSSPNRSSEIRG